MEIDVTVNTNPLNIQVTDIPNLFINPQIGGIQGSVNTGQLAGLFYPLNANPAGYVTSSEGGSVLQVTGSNPLLTGNFTGIGGTQVLLSGNYVLISGGSSINTGDFVTTGQTGNFGNNSIDLKTILSSGIITQYIPYGEILLSLPISIICTFQNDSDNFDYGYSIYSVSTSGFMTSFSDYLDNTGYILNSKVTL